MSFFSTLYMRVSSSSILVLLSTGESDSSCILIFSSLKVLEAVYTEVRVETNQSASLCILELVKLSHC